MSAETKSSELLDAVAEPTRFRYTPPADGSRLAIEKLVLENFKSHGGVKEIGPFHKCFSAIVGPNGSGKSNVIDAILFVSGKRAKQLRLKKVSELIHRSKTIPDAQYAKVSVFFRSVIDTDDSDEGFTVVPGSEFEVTRVAYKNNTSKYYVDGKGSTFTEVTTLLRTRGVDLDNNRFLILQGEVEQIAMMKPKAQTAHEEGLLEYMEDIIGTNKYVAAIEAGAAVLDGLCDERANVLNRARVAEKEKDQLEGSKMETEAFLAKKREVVQQKAFIAQYSGHRAQLALAKHAAKAEAAQEKLAGVREEVAATDKQAAEVEAAYKALHAETEMVQAEQARCKKDFTAYERKDIKLREDLKHQRAQIAKLKKAVERDTKKAAKATQSASDAEKSLPLLEAALEKAQAHKEAMDQAVDDILEAERGTAEKLRVRMEAAQQELAPHSKALNKAKAALDTAVTQQQLLQERVEATSRERAEVTAALEQAQRSLAQRGEELAQVRRDHGARSGRFAELDADMERLAGKEAALGERVKALRSATAEGAAAAQQESSQGRLLAKIMAATRPGKPLAGAGLYGRLGDLGSIDGKYDVAISTACGALNHLVVQSVAGAQACVAYLRQRDLGVATFIIIDEVAKQLGGHMARAMKVPRGTQRLFDLISLAHPRYAPAFFFGLRNTLVASDLEQATAVAFQGGKCMWRVVTLTGELIDTAGTMSGGGRAVRRGGMKAALAGSSGSGSGSGGLSKAEMAAAQRELEAAQRELLETRNLRHLLTAEHRGLAKSVPALRVRASKLEMEVAALTARVAELRERLAEVDARPAVSGEELAELAGLGEEVAALTAAYEAAKDVTDELEAGIAALQEQVRNIGGQRLRQQKAKADAAVEAAEAAASALTKARVDIKSGGKAAAKAQKAADKAAAQLEAAEGKYEALHGQFKAIQEEAFNMMSAFKEAQAVCKAKEAELRQVKGEFERLQKVASRAQKAELDLAQALEDAQRAATGHQAAVAKSEAALSGLAEEFASFLPPEDDLTTLPKQAAAEGEVESKGEDGEAEADSEAGAEAEAEAEAGKAQEEEEGRKLKLMTAGELEGADIDQLRQELKAVEAEHDAMKGNINMGAIAEFRRKEREWLARVEELDAVSSKRDKCRKGFEKLRKQRLDEFMAGFSVITRKLKEMYQMITLGGDAELELVERLDPFSEGIVFSVRPPGKSWKNIRNLSGGEKTLSSLALVFALHHYRPTPLYVMDEIDAALDFKNVSIIAHYIKERTKNAQFIIISLRNNMFEVADRLVGIYKTNDVTKSVTINPKTFAAAASGAAAGGAKKAAAKSERPSAGLLADSTNVA